MRMLAVAMMALPLAACGMSSGSDKEPGIAGTGTGGSRTYQAADFSKVELAGSDDVDVNVGPSFSVRAEGASEDLDRLRIRVRGDTLSIDRQRGGGFSMGGHKVRVLVTLPRLAEASVAGSGNLAAHGVSGDRFKGSLAGSGNLDITGGQLGATSFDVAGSGDVKASGTAKSLEVNIAGSGSIDAPGLRATSAEVSIAGSGDVRATVAGPAKISLMGSGDVDLGREARCTTSKMGSGSVRCG